MTFKIKGKDVEVKFTFNSFKYMQDFDLSVLGNLESQPFMTIPVVEKLLLGGLNWNKAERYSLNEIDVALEEFIEDGDLGALIEGLMEELQASPFFKALQRGMGE